MKKTLSFFLGAFLVLALVPGSAGTEPLLGAKEQVYVTDNLPDDAYLAGGAIVIDGDVNGDLYVAGGSIIVNGNVKGDLFATGGNIAVKGNVQDDVHIGGGNIALSGNIGDDLFVGGGTVIVDKNVSIGGSAFIGGGFVQLQGTVQENLHAGIGTFILGGKVNGNADVTVEEETKVLPTAEIGGNLTYTATKDPQLETGFVKGKYEYKEAWFPRGEQAKKWLQPIAIGALIFFVIANLVLGIVFILAGNFILRKISQTVMDGAPRALGYGFVTFVVLIASMLLAFVTLIGFKIGLFLMLMLFMFFLIIGVLNAYFLTYWLMRGKEYGKGKTILFFLLGLIIYELIALIPLFGWLFAMILALMNLGAVYQVKKDAYAKLRKAKVL